MIKNNKNNFSEELEIAMSAAKQAGEFISQSFRTDFKTKKKSDGSVVTECDVASDNLIRKLLAEVTPYPIFSEEIEGNKLEGTSWVVDPLDGTSNFVKGIPFFSVSIALFIDGLPRLGVVFNPIVNDMFSAVSGGGAYLNNQRIEVSSQDSLRGASVCLGGGRSQEAKLLFNKVFNKIAEIAGVKKLGSNALECCYVASGAFDLFISPESEIYDHGAAMTIVQEAGGALTDWSGENITNKNLRSRIIASNSRVYSQALDLLCSI